MSKQVNLLEGSISLGLTKLAFPIMASSFLQMAYNLTDMLWIGRIGSAAVTSVGVAGMYMWLSAGFTIIARVGGQVYIAQKLGAGKGREAAGYAKTALQLGVVMGMLFGFICMVFAPQLTAFFNMSDVNTIRDAEAYLRIVGGFVFFNFVNLIMTGIWTALGKSAFTFIATAIGLSINMALDPVLIFGIGPFPELGIVGAGIATIFAQVIVFTVFMFMASRDKEIFPKVLNKTLVNQFDMEKAKDIVKIGFPVGIQSMLFTCISMILTRMITEFGDAAIAVQRVGSQIESITWMTAEGFGSAVNTFIAQNYGAKKDERVKRGYSTAFRIMFAWGLVTGGILIFFPYHLFPLFIREPELLQQGVDYLRIMGCSQVFMCIELTTAGAFQGLGKSFPPSIVGIVFTAMRIPLALILSTTALGLNGIWWAITISSVVKGVVLPIWFRRK